MTTPDALLMLALACGAPPTTAATDAASACARLDQQAAGERAAGEQEQVQVPSSAPVASSQPHGDIWRSITLGAGFNHNYPNGEFARFSLWKPYTQGITLDFGEQHAGDDSSVAFSGRYWRQFDGSTVVAVDATGGTVPFAPKWGVGGSISRPVLGGVGVNLGASYRDWRDGNHTTEVGVGLVRWFPHVIVGGGATYSTGEPASFVGWRGSVGLTYYVWKKTYAGVSFDFGMTNNRDWQYDTRSKGLNFGFSRWLSATSGINVSAGGGIDNDVYGVSASWFKEW